jgi:nucleotide-binding universal stress UspA family protein
MTPLAQPTSISIKNILFATDLSPSSETALQYARAFAREPGVRVHTLHVSGPDDYQLLNPEAFAATFRGKRVDARHSLDALKGLLDGLPCEVPVRGGAVWEVIGDVAARNEIDLLILGTHARTGLPKLLFGSVAEEVFRDVAAPVLIVGSDVKQPGPARMAIERVLLATDCNPLSNAPAYAAQVCRQFGAELMVLHVAGEDATPAAQEQLSPSIPVWRRVKETLSEIAPCITELARHPVFLVEYGDPAARVLHAAMELNADLLVLGARHPHDVRTASHSPWGTAAKIIAGAPCPVLTLRNRETAAVTKRHPKAS